MLVARRSRGRWRSRSRSGAGAVTRTEASAVRAVLADWTALSRSIISSRRASRSPSARIWRRVRAGEQLAGRADRVDRVALARPALADVPGAVDLGHLLARGWPGAGPGPARNAGCPRSPTPAAVRQPPRRPRPADCRNPPCVAGTCSCDTTRPRASQIAAVWVSRWVSTPTTRSASSANAHSSPPSVRCWKRRHRPGGKLPRQSCDGSRPAAGQAPDQASEGGQAGAGSTGDMSLARHATRRSGMQESHPAPPGTNPGRSQPSRPVPTCQDSQACKSRRGRPVGGGRQRVSASASDLARLDAGRADVRRRGGAFPPWRERLNVGVPAARGAAVREGDVVAESRPLAADRRRRKPRDAPLQNSDDGRFCRAQALGRKCSAAAVPWGSAQDNRPAALNANQRWC